MRRSARQVCLRRLVDTADARQSAGAVRELPPADVARRKAGGGQADSGDN